MTSAARHFRSTGPLIMTSSVRIFRSPGRFGMSSVRVSSVRSSRPFVMTSAARYRTSYSVGTCGVLSEAPHSSAPTQPARAARLPARIPPQGTRSACIPGGGALGCGSPRVPPPPPPPAPSLTSGPVRRA